MSPYVVLEKKRSFTALDASVCLESRTMCLALATMFTLAGQF